MLNKNLGQHFLRARAVLDDITAAIAPRAEDTILEIGAGDGALTEQLQQSGAHVIALELDRRFADKLAARYSDNPRVRILHCNALTADWRELVAASDNDSGNSSIRLAGNLPYNISAPLLLKMAGNSGWLSDCHVMVQKEMAQRICAPPAASDYGRLSVSLQLVFRPEWLFEVPPDAFVPPPAVQSAVVRLLPQPAPTLPPAFEQVLLAAFAQRRKTLKNALETLAIDWAHCPIDSSRRAQTLAAAEFIELAKHCHPPAQKNSSHKV